jgi:RHS repeat-associated protein
LTKFLLKEIDRAGECRDGMHAFDASNRPAQWFKAHRRQSLLQQPFDVNNGLEVDLLHLLPRASRVLRFLIAIAICTGFLGLTASPPDKSGVKPSVISLPSGAGSIEGLGESFEPQLNTGSSTYGVGITLPPGRTGLAPTVRLSYNSYTGNGICGIGWSLAFRSIKRQTDKGFPEYDGGDTFVFEGEELVPLNNAGQDWRCENERSFQRLRRIDSDSDGAQDAWEVTERNGTRHTYGRFRGQNNRWSVVEHPEMATAQPFDRTYSWLIDSTTDLHGNRIEYEYLQGPGVLYPSRITYGHLAGNSHEVIFQYEARPDAFDDYRPAFATRLDRRLKRIEVRSQGGLVRAYNLGYAYEPGDLTPDLVALQSTYLDLGVTLLKRVVQVDRSGSDANFLPPLIFTYSGLDLTKAEQRGFASPPELDLAEPNGRVQLADLDGDALPDFFATSSEGAGKVQRVCLSRGESRTTGEPRLLFAPSRQVLGSSPVDLAEPNTVVHDPKGKGLVDLSSLTDDGPNKRLDTFGNRARLDLVDENRLGFSLENLEPTILQNPPVWVTYSQAGTRQMDVNFDKRGDFVNLEPSFGAMKVNTFYIGRSGHWLSSEAMLPPSYPLANTFQGPDGLPNPCVHLADMNGDRLLDLICLAATPTPTGQRIRISYWALSGLGRYAEERLIPTQEPDSFEIGSADLHDILVDDITGDGLADVVVLDGSGPETVMTLRVNIAGQRWSPPYVKTGLPRYAPRDAASPTILRLADLNANGSLDLLFRNTSPQSSWAYIELLPRGTPSLMTGVDNSLGKRTTIIYGSAAEDEQLARESGHPWHTFAPLALQVVRQIRTTTGLDLNGDGEEDAAVAEFRYRDPYYDGIEREFRGFAFAQRTDYGDDFVFEPLTGLMKVSAGWDTTRTPTGQRSGPSLVSRYRFHTGAADQKDNDDYGSIVPAVRHIDEFTETGGREEEVLKGLEWVEELVDPVVLHSAVDGAFDAGCEAATAATTLEAQGKLTPDAYVYKRSWQDWTVRRLYRPAEPLPYLADQDTNGILEDYRNAPAIPIPAGRFEIEGVIVQAGSGRSVSFAFVSTNLTEIREANGLLSAALGYPTSPPQRTLKTFDFDNYGNQTLLREYGLEAASYDDERVTTTTYAHGGNALSLWVIDKPDIITTTDENGAFVNKTLFHYDGEPFVGIQGQIQNRGLLNRTVDHIDATRTIQSTRTRFDVHGNIEETRDPVGNVRRIAWDPLFQTYPITEIIVVGGSAPDLKIEAEYDPAFGVIIRSKDINDNITTYHYDSFARLVKIVLPADTFDLPTSAFEYQPSDPIRGRAFVYDAFGNLTMKTVPAGSVNRVTTRQREIPGQPGEYVTASYSDGLGRTLATLEEGELPGTWIVRQATSYNLRGQAQSLWLPYQVSSFDVPQFPGLWPSGRPPATDNINPTVVATDVLYDPQGREIRTVAPPETWDGPRRAAASQYLPFQKRIFDEEDLRTGSPHADTPRVEYSDGLGRLIGVTEVVKLDDEGLTTPVTNHWFTSYQYDLNDRLTRIADSQNNVKLMQYDGVKRKILMNDPDGGVVTYTYDDASNLIETTDAKGQRITYTYDGVNRLLTEEYHDENSTEFSYHRTPDVAYFYDQPAGSVDHGDGTHSTARNTKGLLAYVVDASGEEHTSYDARGRVEWTVKRIRETGLPSTLVSYTTRFEYDSLNRVTRLIYPDNDQVVYQYNARSLLQRIPGGPSGSIISAITYLPSAHLNEIDYGNGVRTTYAYDPRLRLTKMLTSRLPPSEGELIHFSYEFDGVSNIKSIQDQRAESVVSGSDERRNTQTFTYDDLYRLTRVQYNPSNLNPQPLTNVINYRYDRIGNLLAQTSDLTHIERGLSVTDLGTMDYGGTAGRTNRIGRQPFDPPGPHALSGIQHPTSGIRTYPYDASGNMTNIDGLRCTWDFKDRLMTVENDEMRAEYAYDYTNRRITKRVIPKQRTTDDAPLITLYVGKHFEIREHDQPTKYVFNGGTRVARITGSLSTNIRLQRFRLHPGWNLVSLAVGGARLPSSPEIAASYRWNPATRGWESMAPSVSLPAGTILWLHSITNATLALTGTYNDPTNQPVIVGGSFYSNAGLEALPLVGVRADFELWHFDSSSQIWQLHLPSIPDSDPGSPEFLGPGQAFFMKADVPSDLEIPDAALRIRYYHQDHLGSSSVITDAAGALVEETAFYPFGLPRQEYRLRQIEEHYKFSEKERDQESGLHYFAARYLAGRLSRFVSVDPKFANPDALSSEDLNSFLLQPQKINLYSYAVNNPLKYVDPTGLGPWSWFRENVWIPGVDDLDELDVGRTLKVAGGVALAVATSGGSLTVQIGGGLIASDQVGSGILGKESFVHQIGTAACGGNESCGTIVEVSTTVGVSAGPSLARSGVRAFSRPPAVTSSARVAKSTVDPLAKTMVDPLAKTVPGAIATTIRSSADAAGRTVAIADPVLQSVLAQREAFIAGRLAETRVARDVLIDSAGGPGHAGSILNQIFDEADSIYGNLDDLVPQ